MAYVNDRRSGMSVGTVIYLIIGVVVAANQGYLVFTSLSSMLSALLAVLLWPLLLFGISLHIALGA